MSSVATGTANPAAGAVGLAVSRRSFLQRIHLAATIRELAVQPLNQVFERVDREIAAGLEPSFQTALVALTGADEQIVTAFRIGHPTITPRLSPRRPAEEVLLT